MRVGVLGGGQLGRMLALSGYQLGIEFRFFDDAAALSTAFTTGELDAVSGWSAFSRA